jgi:uncharacterized protein YqeY
MSIEAQLNEALKNAMRQKHEQELLVIRQIKTKMSERKTAPGFKGTVDDALWLEVIGAYVKAMKKAREEYANAGERGAERIVEIDFEVAYLEKYLPKQMSEDEIRTVVTDTIAALGVTSKQKAGQVVGAMSKQYKGLFDATVAKKIAEELLP